MAQKVIVKLNIRNALNFADWGKTIQSLRQLNVPRSLMKIVRNYFSNRVLLVDNNLGTETHEITAGVSQGSDRGPLLWNVMYDGRKILETAQMEVSGMAITSQRAIKCLGVMIDARLSFREHLEYIQGKALATTRSLAQILLNSRGPRQNRRILLMSVALAQVLYATPIWAKAMNTPSYSRGVNSAYKLR